MNDQGRIEGLSANVQREEVSHVERRTRPAAL